MLGWHWPFGHQQVLEDRHLAAEVVLGLVAGGAGGDHHLDGDRPVGRELAGEVDLAHPAAADRLLDQVVGVGRGELLAAARRRPGRARGGRPRPAASARPGRRRRSRGSGAAARPPRLVLDDGHGERALAGRDHVAVAEPGRSTRRPLTFVPLVLPRSSRSQSGGLTSIRKCSRESSRSSGSENGTCDDRPTSVRALARRTRAPGPRAGPT